jgi:hypothetical protein
MKSNHPTFRSVQPGLTIRRENKTPQRSLFKFAVAVCVAMVMTIASITPASAGSEGITLQFEFSLAKKPTFKQFNLSLQNNSSFSDTQSLFPDDTGTDYARIPVYSSDIRNPGFLNLLIPGAIQYRIFGLDASDSENQNKKTPGQILGVIGLVGLLAYGIKHEIDEGCSGAEIIVAALLTQGYVPTGPCPDTD